MKRHPEELGTILGVWAHPDDETYLSAGVMAAATRNGQRVVCVTATRGEDGSQDDDRWPTATLTQVREAELMNALDILGVTEHVWLGYRDGECSAVPFEDAVAALERIVRDVAPDSVLTFGPDGMTGHPDHLAVSRWTTEAFGRAAKQGSELYYATTTPNWMETFGSALDAYEVFFAGRPELTTIEELGVHYELPDDVLDLKVRALEAQVSQSETLIEAVGRDFLLASERQEFYRLATTATSLEAASDASISA